MKEGWWCFTEILDSSIQLCGKVSSGNFSLGFSVDIHHIVIIRAGIGRGIWRIG